MSSITVDFITMAWAVVLLVLLAHFASQKRSVTGGLMALSVGLYLIAQSGWTTAYLSGYEWGRDLSNYVWFIFNSSVFLVYSSWVCRCKGDKQ
jgi:hypothetical protein